MTDLDAGAGPAGPFAVSAGESDSRLDHGALAGRSVLLGSLLTELGLVAGDVVAVLAGQSTAVYELMMGVRQAGMVLAAVDPDRTLEQNAFAINTSGAAVLVADTVRRELAQALVPLTPQIRARFCLDGDFPNHRSLALARVAVPVRSVDGHPAGFLHHAYSPLGRPVAFRTPDPLDTEVGQAHCADLLGDVVPNSDTVLVGSTAILTPTAALLGAAVLGSGGGVVVPRRPTGVDLLRSAAAVDAVVLHLSADVATEVAALPRDRVLALTPARLRRVIVDGAEPAARAALVGLWGELVWFVDEAYWAEELSEAPVPDFSATQALI